VCRLASIELLHPTVDKRDWREWLERMGLGDKVSLKGQVFDTLELGMIAAARGYGISMGDLLMVAEDVAQKRLSLPWPTAVPSGMDYYLVWPRTRRGGERLRRLSGSWKARWRRWICRMWKSCRLSDRLHRLFAGSRASPRAGTEAPHRTQVQCLCAGLQRAALALCIQRQLILHLQPQRRFEGIAVGVAAVLGLRIVAQVGLEDPRRAHRQEVLVHQRLEVHMASVDQPCRVVGRPSWSRAARPFSVAK
jgi:hypothetical protein